MCAGDKEGSAKPHATTEALAAATTEQEEHNHKMFRVLFTSHLPLAAFLRDTCEATGQSHVHTHTRWLSQPH